MPELPEVETIRRDLEGRLLGARLGELWTSGKPLRLNRPLPAAEIRQISVGKRVVALRRRAKYLLIDLEGDGVLLVHLGMTGQLRVSARSEARPLHTHVAWPLDGARGTEELRFVDVRRFGMLVATRRDVEDELPELAVLGLDPLGPELTAGRLVELARAARRDWKTFLLDQSRIAGLGNIYVSEALFEAGLHPAARTNRLKPERAEALRAAIVLVLERGLENRGTTLRDYVDASGGAGLNQHALKVYGRDGQECPRGDGGRVRRVVTQGRSTFFCPVCQKR